MKISISQKKDNIRIISVEGDVDMYSSPKLRDKIARLTNDKVSVIMINLKEVHYMDSSGLATFVEGMQNAKKYKGKFILCGLQTLVYDVFKLTKLENYFDIYYDEETAFSNI